eukprot:m.375130 g.375130  ORF g.375130 m.375130 type:complete len:57 (+) comp20914_c0_seq2:483-653(+)
MPVIACICEAACDAPDRGITVFRTRVLRRSRTQRIETTLESQEHAQPHRVRPLVQP